MGVVTAYINPRILNMNYPLTIAGMSTGSVGARANIGQKTNEEFEKMMKENKKDGNVGGFCATYWERLLPNTGTDTSSLYGSFLRAISFGIIPEVYLDQVFNWKDMFMDLAQEFNVQDVALDRKIHEMQYAAMKHGDEFLNWFNEAIYEPALTPRLIDEEAIKEQAKKKTYQCGTTPQGGMVLDASEYGVENVYDAVQLFAKLTNL